MLLVGNGCGFLQMCVMLKDKDVLAITHNEADYHTLLQLNVPAKKDEFQSYAFSALIEQFDAIVIHSTQFLKQIMKAFENADLKDKVLIYVKHDKTAVKIKHPYVYYIDPKEAHDGMLWNKVQSLIRLSQMSEFILKKIPEGLKTAKMLILFYGPPDPDAIASGVGFHQLFSKQTEVTFASTARVKRFENRALLSYLNVKVLNISQLDINEYQIIVCLDSQPSFFLKGGFDIPFHICIDHHPESAENPAIPFLDVRKSTGSCATIISQYFLYTKKSFNKRLATALLMALKTDTVNFTRSLYDSDLEVLQYLYKKADREVIRKLEFSQVPKRAIKYFKRAYNRSLVNPPLWFCYLGRVTYLDIGSILADQFLKVQKINLSLVALVSKDLLIVYLRSMNKLFNSGEIASKLFYGFGVGGGHVEMGRAECLLSQIPCAVKDIESYLKNVVYDIISDKIPEVH